MPIDVSNTRARFTTIIEQITTFIGDRPLNDTLESALNATFPADGSVARELLAACHTAIAEGWMCAREANGIRYGRVIKPDAVTRGFSVDVVDMHALAGPQHRHPNGEIDFIMPLEQRTRFDGRPAGWLVYAPGSSHAPTVTGGRALVLYLLPQGAIDFGQQ